MFLGFIVTSLISCVVIGIIVKSDIDVTVRRESFNILDTQIVAEVHLDKNDGLDFFTFVSDFQKRYADKYETIAFIPEEKDAPVLSISNNKSLTSESLNWFDGTIRTVLNWFISEKKEFIHAKNYDGDTVYFDLIKEDDNYFVYLIDTVSTPNFKGDIITYKNISTCLLPFAKYLFLIAGIITILLICGNMFIFWTAHNFFILPIRNINKDLEAVIDKEVDRDFKMSSASASNKDILKLADNLNLILDGLKLLNNSSKEFIDEVVHETKNPVNNIINLAEIAKDLFPESAEDMDLIVQQGLTISSLLDSLRDATEISLRRGVPTSSDVDPLPILKNIINEYSVLHEDRIFHLDITSDFKQRINMADKMFVLIIRNILGNAIKFADPGTPIRITVSTNEWNWTEIVIRNKGPEIPVELHDKIFEKYYRPNSTKGKYVGSGLGLWIVKEIIDMYEGYIFARSMNGSTFFTLVFKPPASIAKPIDEDWANPSNTKLKVKK